MSNPRQGQGSWGLPLAAALLTILILATVAGTIYFERGMIFDDAFISFRYSKNLAAGEGLTWNPGAPPTEGYTNFLFVVALAPFISLGWDPLLVARLMSLLAASGLAAIYYRIGRKWFAFGKTESLLAVLALIAATRTDLVGMLGMETVIYAFCLGLAFWFALHYFQHRTRPGLWGVGLVSCLAIWLRPDGVLFPAVFALVAWGIPRPRLVPLLQLIRTWSFALVLPMAAYLAWKWHYYGDIFPNPFYIKATAGALIQPEGFWSVLDFVAYHRVLIALALSGVFLMSSTPLRKRPGEFLAVAFTAVYLAFYLRVNTLMDAGGRFLYPLAPFLVYLSLPALAAFWRRLAALPLPELAKGVLVGILFVCLFYSNLYDKVITLRWIMLGKRAHASPDSLMQKEYRLSRVFQEYPGIKNVTIAMGDVGVFGYFTDAQILDTVGLNDTFIARNRDYPQLADYVFSRKPTVALAESAMESGWFEERHGPFKGHFSRLMADPRWDEYAYVGTVVFSSMYYFQVFLRHDYADFEEFRRFLQDRIVDRTYDVFPLPYGTYRPPAH